MRSDRPALRPVPRSGTASRKLTIAPLRRIAGEREGPAPKAWEGEVTCRRLRRSAAAHLTPALSPRKRAERENLGLDHKPKRGKIRRSRSGLSRWDSGM